MWVVGGESVVGAEDAADDCVKVTGQIVVVSGTVSVM